MKGCDEKNENRLRKAKIRELARLHVFLTLNAVLETFSVAFCKGTSECSDTRINNVFLRQFY